MALYSAIFLLVLVALPFGGSCVAALFRQTPVMRRHTLLEELRSRLCCWLLRSIPRSSAVVWCITECPGSQNLVSSSTSGWTASHG